MGLLDRLRKRSTPDPDQAPAGGAGPAAAAGFAGTPTAQSGEVSQAGSSFSSQETSTGGADAVADTPDIVSENYT